ncbi:hypothetical protein L9F63_000651 [Diploptera punctata]|uniref:Uncharacterized protein n=1 Tax=Diploptera punctata TaxID=6984 RepID=A0AAD8ESH9_DIPPU|nr:hypothetical protein L9F63_000651 [Diploptera punctata]
MWMLSLQVVCLISACSAEILLPAERKVRSFSTIAEGGGSEGYGAHGTDYNEQGTVGFYGAAGQKGSRARLSNDRYAGNQQSARGDRARSGHFHNDAGARTGYNVGRAGYGDRTYGNKQQTIAGIGSQGGHRKGHHSSGFKSSYHKDEAGNKSQFYDDANDQGGHFLYDARDGIYQDRGADAYGGEYDDAAYRDQERGKQGAYGEEAGFNDRSGHQGRYSQDDFRDDKAAYDVGKSGNNYGKAGNVYYGEDELYTRPIRHRYYRPKVYYPVESYPIPYASYNQKVDDSAIRGKGKGYAEYVDYGGKGGYNDDLDY